MGKWLIAHQVPKGLQVEELSELDPVVVREVGRRDLPPPPP
jgi:hypothetical protein